MAQYEQVILALMSADNSVRDQAEQAYNQAKAKPDELITVLVTLLANSAKEQVRSLCGVLVRKLFMQSSGKDASTSTLASLSPPVREQMKGQLLMCIGHEPKRNIQKKICDAVGQLGLTLLTEDINAWPELGPFILTATRGADHALHECAFTILNALSDFVAEKWKSTHAELLQVYKSSLQATFPLSVRNSALKALASFLSALETPKDRQPFTELVPYMLQTIADALQENAEDECRDALEVFVEIADSNIKFLKKDLQSCVNAMITIAMNRGYEDSLRHLALEFLLTAAESAPTMARKLPDFCANAVPVALQMMLEIECDTPEDLQEWEDEEEDDEKETEINNYDVGEEALDRLAIAMGGKTMMPILSKQIQEWFPSDDWKQRHAALMAISQSGEGCEAQMAKQLENIVKVIVTKFIDPHPRVRWAAINTIGQMSTDFGPQIQIKLHDTVLPKLLQAMDDGSKRVQAHAAAAVINFCEHCERPTLKPYLPELLSKLMALLQRDQRRVQEQAVTAVASVADVAESDFTPFYDEFMPRLKHFLQAANSKEYRMLRGKAMECISLIGVAVGKEKFGADAQEVMELLIQTRGNAELEADDPQISFMLQACARICKCLGELFKPYLPFVIPPLLASAQIDPELHVTDADEEDDAEEEEGFESVTVAIRGQGNKRITIRTSALEEKATACSMLHSYVADLKEGFFPYVQDVARILVPLIKFQYMDDVRTAAMMTMPELLDSAIRAAKASMAGATPELVAQLKDFIYPYVLEQLKAEPDVETLTCMLDAFGELLLHGDDFAPAQLGEPQLNQCAEVLNELVKESYERREEQRKRQDEEDVDEEEQQQIEGEAEREECLMQSLLECISGLFKVYKVAFLPTFQRLLQPHFQAMLMPNTQPTDRVTGLCVFDDIIEHCSANGANNGYIPDLFKALIQYSTDENAEVRQAAVYGIGLLAEHASEEVFTAALQEQAAQTMLAVCNSPAAYSEEAAPATDNAVSALGKLCKRSEAISAVALPRWLGALPLKADKGEALVVHRSLCEMVEASNPHLLGASHERLPDIICVFGQILGTDLVDEEVSPRITHLLKQVHSGLPHVLQGLPAHPGFALLTPQQKGELEKALSG